MSVSDEWEDKLSSVMEQAAGKIRSLADERTQLTSRHRLLSDELHAQEDVNSQSKHTIQKLMEEITAQLKLKYELEHDISRIHSRKLFEEKDLPRFREETKKAKDEARAELLRHRARAVEEQKRREAAQERKKEAVGKLYVENDRLRTQLADLGQEIVALKVWLRMRNGRSRWTWRRRGAGR